MESVHQRVKEDKLFREKQLVRSIANDISENQIPESPSADVTMPTNTISQSVTTPVKAVPSNNHFEEQNAYQKDGASNVKAEDNKIFHFRHPFTMLIAGPTSCGKTTWIKALLEQSQSMIVPPPRKIFWFYKRWQPLYSEMQRLIPNIHFLEGIGTQEIDAKYPRLYIFDDLMILQKGLTTEI